MTNEITKVLFDPSKTLFKFFFLAIINVAFSLWNYFLFENSSFSYTFEYSTLNLSLKN